MGDSVVTAMNVAGAFLILCGLAVIVWLAVRDYLARH